MNNIGDGSNNRNNTWYNRQNYRGSGGELSWRRNFNQDRFNQDRFNQEQRHQNRYQRSQPINKIDVSDCAIYNKLSKLLELPSKVILLKADTGLGKTIGIVFWAYLHQVPTVLIMPRVEMVNSGTAYFNNKII